MEKTYNQKYSETIYNETLNNGLEVTIFYKPEFVTSSAVFATPYGSLDAKQIVNGELHNVHFGAAHFLEHKLFEDEDKDIFRSFSEIGANVNAFTSHFCTAYYFSSTEKDIRKPLGMLLDFVQELKIDKKSVNKEKGIIIQELMMYKQQPEMRILGELLESLYVKHPIRMDIGGTASEVKKTTVEELYDSYYLNYHPRNMSLFIVTCQNPKQVMELVKENQAKKTFKEYSKPTRFVYDEPENTKHKKVKVKMDVTKTKVALGFKLNNLKCDSTERLKIEWACKYLLDAYFSSVNPIYQKWLDEKVISDYFSYDIELNEDYSTLLFFNETDDPSGFKRMIIRRLKAMKPDKISKKLIEQLQHRNYGIALGMMDVPDELAFNYMVYKFKGVDFFDSLEIPQQITIADLVKAKEILDTTNYSLVTIEKA